MPDSQICDMRQEFQEKNFFIHTLSVYRALSSGYRQSTQQQAFTALFLSVFLHAGIL